MAITDVERLFESLSPVNIELAWAAGFFDGEGGFYINKGDQSKRQKWTLQTSIKQVDIRPLERFQRAVGVGNINGPYDSHSKTEPPYNRQLIHRWSAYRGNAEKVAELLKPYLSEPKREQLNKATKQIEEFNNTRKNRLELV
jgi:hypothetical protein